MRQNASQRGNEQRILADSLLGGEGQTLTAMEEWNIANVRAALERGELNNVVPEHADM